jgi:hypothetical protein
MKITLTLNSGSVSTAAGPFTVSGTTDGGSLNDVNMTTGSISTTQLTSGWRYNDTTDTITGGTINSSGTCITGKTWLVIAATPTPTPTPTPTVSYELYTADRYTCDTTSGPCTFVETLQIANPTVLIEGKFYYDNLNSYIFNIVSTSATGPYLYTDMSGLGTNNCSSLCSIS